MTCLWALAPDIKQQLSIPVVPWYRMTYGACVSLRSVALLVKNLGSVYKDLQCRSVMRNMCNINLLKTTQGSKPLFLNTLPLVDDINHCICAQLYFSF